MFSGIVAEVAKVSSVSRADESYMLGIEGRVFNDCQVGDCLKAGDSIAISGVCLTVAKCENGSVYFELGQETRRVTTLGDLKSGDLVNVELSVKVGDRLHGHFVQGHVDGVVKICRTVVSENTRCVEFELGDWLKPYIVPKGAITIDGVSLTVVAVAEKTFSVHLIPETVCRTTFASKASDDVVNVEIDIVARYLQGLKKIYET